MHGMLTHPHFGFLRLAHKLCEGCGNCIDGLGDTVFPKLLSVSCLRLLGSRQGLFRG